MDIKFSKSLFGRWHGIFADILMVLLLAPFMVVARTIPSGTTIIDGVTWHYYVMDGKAKVDSIETAKTGPITIPSTLGGAPVATIGMGAFYECRGMTAVSIPPSVTSIGDSAFSGCTRLTSVTIPEGVTSIGMLAFNGCSALVLAKMPSTVKSIGWGAFEDTKLMNTHSAGQVIVDGCLHYHPITKIS